MLKMTDPQKMECGLSQKDSVARGHQLVKSRTENYSQIKSTMTVLQIQSNPTMAVKICPLSEHECDPWGPINIKQRQTKCILIKYPRIKVSHPKPRVLVAQSHIRR